MRKNKIPVPPALDSAKTRILVVDDDPHLLKALERYLARQETCEVRTAASRLAAGIALKAFKPHVVVLDILLGDIDGREFLAALRKDPELSDVKAIAISDFIKEGEARSLFKRGFDAYFPKPFPPAALLAEIGRLVPARS